MVNHLLHHDGPAEYRDTTVRRLARKIAPATLDDLMAVMWADHLGRPPLVSAETEKRLGFFRQAAQKLALEHAAPRPIMLGRHLIALGRTPGPLFKPALDAAFEYNRDLFEPATIEAITNRFLTLLEDLAAGPRGEVGVQALAAHHQRREQLDRAPAEDTTRIVNDSDRLRRTGRVSISGLADQRRAR